MITKEMRDAAERFPEKAAEPFDKILGLGGLDVVVLLVREYGGSSLYIPSLRSILRDCVKAAALEDAEGRCNVNYTDFAKKYGYSVNQMRSILN